MQSIEKLKMVDKDVVLSWEKLKILQYMNSLRVSNFFQSRVLI